jgi:hypothetical protein
MNQQFLLFTYLIDERNKIRDGWLPDYGDKDQIKFSVNQWEGKFIAIAKFAQVFDLFTFQSEEKAQEFWDSCKEELEDWFLDML